MDAAINMQQVQHIEPLLVRYAMRAVRREDLARDLVQETWAAARLHRGRKRLRNDLRDAGFGVF